MEQSRAQRRSQFKRGAARGLRSGASEAERILWGYLRRKQIAGLRFRRQHPIGPYIVDFFCPAARLVVELDGGQHGEDQAVLYDARRTQWLEARGYRVLRIWNHEFFENRDAALEGIWLAVKNSATPLPEALRASTLPQGEG